MANKRLATWCLCGPVPLHSDERCMKIQLVNLADNAWSEKQNGLLGKFTARAVVQTKPSDGPRAAFICSSKSARGPRSTRIDDDGALSLLVHNCQFTLMPAALTDTPAHERISQVRRTDVSPFGAELRGKPVAMTHLPDTFFQGDGYKTAAPCRCVTQQMRYNGTWPLLHSGTSLSFYLLDF